MEVKVPPPEEEEEEVAAVVAREARGKTTEEAAEGQENEAVAVTDEVEEDDEEEEEEAVVVGPPPLPSLPDDGDAEGKTSTTTPVAAAATSLHEFPQDMQASPERLAALRARRDAEATRQAGRRARRSCQAYVLPLRISLLLLFATLLLERLDGDIDSYYVVFVPLWIMNGDKIFQAAINFREGALEARLEGRRRYDLQLPAVSSMLIDSGSVLTKIFMAATLIGQLDWTYRAVFTPTWVAVSISTVLIALTPERPEVRNPRDTICAVVWRRIVTASVWCAMTILMPLLVVNKVDHVSNTSWDVVFMPVWFILVVAGTVGVVFLPIYAIMVLLNCFRQAGLHHRSDRHSIAKLLVAFSYGIVSTVVGLGMFLDALTTRLKFEAFTVSVATAGSDLVNVTVSNHSSTTPAPNPANITLSNDTAFPGRDEGSNLGFANMTNAQIMGPLIAVFANLFVFVLYVRFVMIRRRLRRREMARRRFEQEAFDPQGGGARNVGPSFSSEQTLFEAFVEPVFLEAHEGNVLFEVATANSHSFQSLTKVSPEGGNGGAESGEEENRGDEEVGGEAKRADESDGTGSYNLGHGHDDFFTPDSGQTCFICADKPPNSALLPCGHGGLCFRCGQVLARQEGKQVCPICRSAFTQVVKISRKEVRNGKLVYVAETGMKKKGSGTVASAPTPAPAPASEVSAPTPTTELMDTGISDGISDLNAANSVEAMSFEGRLVTVRHGGSNMTAMLFATDDVRVGGEEEEKNESATAVGGGGGDLEMVAQSSLQMTQMAMNY